MRLSTRRVRERISNADLAHERRERRGLNTVLDPDGTYRVECVVSQRKTASGALSYKLRWEGWAPEDDTWTKASDVADDLG